MTLQPPAESRSGTSLKRRQSPSHREGGTGLTGRRRRLPRRTRPRADRLIVPPEGRTDQQSDVASRRTRTLLSFQGSVPEGGQRKGLRSRQRPPVRRATKRSYPVERKALLVGCRTFLCHPHERPKECSRATLSVKKARRYGQSGVFRPGAGTRPG